MNKNKYFIRGRKKSDRGGGERGRRGREVGERGREVGGKGEGSGEWVPPVYPSVKGYTVLLIVYVY